MVKARSKATAEERRLDALHNILLGSFLIAQVQHKPQVKAMVMADWDLYAVNPNMASSEDAMRRRII